MVDKHSQSFFGQSSGITLVSTSKSNDYIFFKCIKKKENGIWEKPSLKEGKTIKCNLDEIVMILEVLRGKRKVWSSYHNFNENKTSISFKWDENSNDKLYINIANYSKMLSFSQIEILRMLLQHLLKEKIIHATIPKKRSFKSERGAQGKLKEFSDNENDDLPVIIEEKINMDGEKITEVNGSIKGESEKALLLNLTNGKEMWFPKSVIHSNYIPEKEVNQSFKIDSWILKKNNIIVKTM
jgi:hypothetical protein